MVKWDIKLWVISILLGIALSLGTYNLRALSAGLNGVKERAEALIIRQAVTDEKFLDVKLGIARVELQIIRLETLIEKTHPRAK